jgi:hypothetical protein
MVLVVLVSIGIAACENGPTGAETLATESVILSAMEEALQDEYRAELIYMRVIEDFGPVQPFWNIINAEVRHSEAIGSLYENRGLAVPASKWEAGDIPSYSSVTEACKAGVQAEIDNAEIYERHLALELPEDVRRVFENNQSASLDRHLPSFEMCS